MKLWEVSDSKTRKEFLRLPVRLYQQDKNWIRPLDKDIEMVFDPNQNKYFKHGECTRWILTDEDGKTIGRVASFINHKTAQKFDQPTGGMGFFECINDQAAATHLFENCEKWLSERGMQAMDGPINFGDRDRWWGLLVDGFTEPNYCTPYNFPYYQSLFENFGFKTYFKQFTYARKVKEGGLLPKVQEKADKVRENPDFHFQHIKKKYLPKYAEDFRVVFNKAWARHLGVKDMSKEQAESIMKKLRPVLDEKIIIFGYHKNEPIAFYINLPELNQIFKHVNGKLDIIGKLKFLYHKHLRKVDKMFGVSFGVIPEFHGQGIEAALADAISEIVWDEKSPYIDYEMNWIGDFNPKMMHVAENMGGKINKTHITYRKLFDPKLEFKRAPIIE